MCWEPPRGRARAAGGLLGVIGGEAWRGPRGRFEAGGPVTAALLDLCERYVDEPSDEPPVDVAKTHAGVPGVAWLLPVALVRLDPDQRAHDTRELAAAAGIASYAMQASVAYVELAAQLFAAKRPRDAIRVATVPAPPAELGSPAHQLVGVGPIDGLITSVWAIERDGNLASVVPQLVHADPPTDPWVAAAAAGCLGVRDGCAAIPAQWHRGTPARERDRCFDLAGDLVLAAHHDLGGPPQAVGQ